MLSGELLCDALDILKLRPLPVFFAHKQPDGPGHEGAIEIESSQSTRLYICTNAEISEDSYVIA